MTNLDSVLKSRDITLPTEVTYSQVYGFSSSHVWIWELDHKEGWAQKKWCFWTAVLEKTLESLGLHRGQSNQSILKEINPEYSLEGLMLKLKLQYFGHLLWRVDSLEKSLRQEEKGTTDKKMVWCHHQLNGHEFEQDLGDGEGQGSLVLQSMGFHVQSSELYMTEWLNNKIVFWWCV